MIPEFAVQIDPNSIYRVCHWSLMKFDSSPDSFPIWHLLTSFHLRYLVMALTYRSFPSGHRGSWVPRGSGTFRWHRPGLCESASRTWNQPWRNQHGGRDFPDKRWVSPEEKVERFVKNMSVQKDGMDGMDDWNRLEGIFVVSCFWMKVRGALLVTWFSSVFIQYSCMAHGPFSWFPDVKLKGGFEISLMETTCTLSIAGCPAVGWKTVGAYRADAIAEKLRLPVVPEAQSCGRFPLFGRRKGWVVDGWNPGFTHQLGDR